MPSTAQRLRVLLVAAAAVALPFVALSLPGTASAVAPAPRASGSAGPTDGPTSTPTGNPSPSCTGLGCVVPTPPIGSKTPSPTPKATPSPTAHRTATPKPTSTRRTRTVQPQATATDTGSTQNPVTGTINIGGVKGGDATDTPVPTITPKDSSSSGGTSDHLGRLLFLVLGGAVLLGISGATGLYLTRHRHEP